MNINKSTRTLCLLASLLLGANLYTIQAQEASISIKRTTKPRPGEAIASNDTLSQRLKLHNLDLTQGTNNASWMRTIYRQLDLTKEKNAPLYYPTRTTEQAKNFFAHIFKLVVSGQINVYEYLDGEELFTPEYKVKLKDLLDRFRINYTENRGRGEQLYTIANADIPTTEVKAYYIKETWYFDQTTSSYDVKIDAICPILYDLGDYGEVPMPLFWLPYEEIKPFISSSPVILSSYNNKANATLDDFFRLRMYDGDIIKTKNLLNQSLAQYTSSPDSLNAERLRIEGELEGFKQKLFIAKRSDTAPEVSTTETSVVEQSSVKVNSRDKRVRSTKTAKAKTPKPAKQAKVKAPKQSKPSGGGRSVRGRI